MFCQNHDTLTRIISRLIVSKWHNSLNHFIANEHSIYCQPLKKDKWNNRIIDATIESFMQSKTGNWFCVDFALILQKCNKFHLERWNGEMSYWDCFNNSKSIHVFWCKHYAIQQKHVIANLNGIKSNCLRLKLIKMQIANAYFKLFYWFVFISSFCQNYHIKIHCKC